MSNKLTRLQELVAQTVSTLEELSAENYKQKNRIRALENNLEKLRGAEEELRQLREWRRDAEVSLRRLAAKIEKEIQKAEE